MASKKYPDVLFVIEDGEGDDTFLNAAKEASTHACIGEKISVAVYKFAHFATVSADVKIDQKL